MSNRVLDSVDRARSCRRHVAVAAGILSARSLLQLRPARSSAHAARCLRRRGRCRRLRARRTRTTAPLDRDRCAATRRSCSSASRTAPTCARRRSRCSRRRRSSWRSAGALRPQVVCSSAWIRSATRRSSSAATSRHSTRRFIGLTGTRPTIDELAQSFRRRGRQRSTCRRRLHHGSLGGGLPARSDGARRRGVHAAVHTPR